MIFDLKRKKKQNVLFIFILLFSFWVGKNSVSRRQITMLLLHRSGVERIIFDLLFAFALQFTLQIYFFL